MLTPNVVGAVADAGLTHGRPGRGRRRLRSGPVHRVCGWGWPPPPPTGTRWACRCTGCARWTRSASRPAVRCWWSPTPAVARCTGPATATVCASTGPVSAPQPTCPSATPRRWPDPRTHAALFDLPCHRHRRTRLPRDWLRAVTDWTAEPGPLVPLYLRRPDAKTLAERGVLPVNVSYGPLHNEPTPPAAPSWRRMLFDGDDPWPEVAFVRELAAAAQPLRRRPGRRQARRLRAASPGWAGRRRSSTRSTPSAWIPRIRARASAGG